MITLRYNVFDRNDRLVTKEKTFKSEEALQRWTEKQENDNPKWAGVEAYSYDENR